MTSEDRPRLDHALLERAFETMGGYLSDRAVLGEIAVYGGTAILLQFDWRKNTEDVDAIVRDGTREGVIKDAAAFASLWLNLPDDWLNNAVGAFTPEDEPASFFSLLRSYPRHRAAGLRVFLARPEYLLAMKLKALQRNDVGMRDFDDVVSLARATGQQSVADLLSVFASFFPCESIDPLAALQLPDIVTAIQQRTPK